MKKSFRLFISVCVLLTFTAYYSFAQGDSCQSATVLSNVVNYCSGATQYTNVGATKNVTGYGLPGCWSTGFGNPTEDVWFSFTAVGSDIFITIKGTGNGGATIKQPRIALYIGPCSATISQLACTDGNMFAPNNGLSQLYYGGLVLGTTYLVRVSSSPADEGTFQLCANNYTPTTNPGADCGGAAILCNKDAITVPKLSGPGLDNDEPEAGSCMDVSTVDESNSCWYTFTCQNSGTLTMDIVPTVSTDDIDFTFYELVGTNVCSTSGATKRKIRRCAGAACVATNNGKTGMNMVATDSSEAQSLTMPYCTGNIDAYVKYLDIVAGRSYAILINNANANGSFTINWGGSSTFLGPTAIITSSATTICAGQTVTFNGSTSTNYSSLKWSFNSGGNPTSATGPGPHTITYSTPGNYVAILEATSAQGCKTVETVDIIVKTPLTISVPPATICPGANATLTASGATTYSWSPATGISTTTGTSVTASPASTTTYTVTGTSPGSCSVTTTVVVTVNSTPTITVPPASICPGGSTALTASGANTYTWSPATGLSGTIGTSITASPASTTTYTVSGTATATGCSNTTTVVVTIIPKPTITVSSATICSGTSATLTATGGTTYLWSTTETSNPITVSPSATASYTVTGTTSNCTNSAIATVTVTIPPVATATANSPCVGSTLNLTSTGGTSWTWTGPSGYTSSSQNPTRSSATVAMNGTYTVTVTAAGCTGTATVNVTVIPNPVVTVNSPSICQGETTTLTANGATTYVWSTTETSNPITVSPSATASYTVTGTTGTCSATAVATVTVNPPCGINVNATSATVCAGACATITANANSGTTPYTYLWNTGATTSAISPCPAGTTTYTITVTDNTGASATATGIITINPNPVVTVNSPVVCAGQTATLTANGGTTYVWSTMETSNPITVSPGATASYTVTGTTGTCTGSAEAVVTVNPIPVVIVNSPGICPGGTATLTATGATTYLWSTMETINPITVSPLSNSSYTVTGTSAGCTASAVSTVTIGALTADAGHDISICPLTSDTLNATGGTSYTWSPATGLNNTTIPNPIASPSATTTYTVTVTSGSCTATDAVVVTVNAPIVLNTAGIDMTCNGICNGQLIVIPSGGSPPYTYGWSSGCTNAACSNVCAGSYTITITDLAGCTAMDTVSVNEPPALTAAVSGTPASCNGKCDGTATVSANGGEVSYTYSWNTSPAQTTAVATGLCATNYTCTVSDANSCSVKVSVTILEPTPIVLAPISNVAICINSSATLTAFTSGGTPGYNYNWLPSGTGTAAAVTISPIVTTTYTVSVTDASGCSANPQMVVVTVRPPLTVDATGTKAVCPGTSVTLTATASGGDGALSYSWSPGSENTSVISVTPSVTTNYTVTVSDGCGTTPVTDSVRVIILPVPNIAFTSDIISGCAPICVNFTDGTTITGGTIASWNWNFNDAPVSKLPSPSHCFKNPGKYSITLTASSDGGCSSTFTNTDMITVFANPVAAFEPTPNPATLLDPNITFINQSTSDVNYWFWDFGDGDSLAPSASNPVHTYPKELEGTYTVTLIVSNANGCFDTTSREVVIGPIFTFFIPNAFSPNNDGINDEFFGKGEGIVQYDIWIFDRWGNMIFHGDRLNNYWNGRANGGNQIAQQDVYVWKVKLTDVFHKKHDYIGTVTLVK